MDWTLDEQLDTCEGAIRWRSFGAGGDPIVLVHGTPYSSFLWRDIAPALARTRTVFVFDQLGYGESEKGEGQDLTLAAQARRFVRLLDEWGLNAPSVVANDIGGAIVPRSAARGSTVFGSDVVRLCQRGVVGAWPVCPDPPAPRGVRRVTGLCPPGPGHQPSPQRNLRGVPPGRPGDLSSAMART